MNMKDLLSSITPDEEEREEAFRIFNEIRTYIQEKYQKESILVGSVAKDTFLKNDKDLDIFVFFDESVSRKNLEDESLKIGKSVFMDFNEEYEIAYAEHPYVKGIVKGFDIEIVPCYKLKNAEDIQSAVDRTPFHLTYVINNLTEKEKGDVRLLKKLLKSQKLYGADARANGFSGYLCELLIIRYGSIEKLMENAMEWAIGTRIELKKSVNEFKAPLIVIDPVDPNRNVASAVSLDSFSRFVLLCRNYNLTKDLKLFKEVEKGYQAIEGGSLFVIEFHIDVLDDIFYAQCRKFLKYLIKLSLSLGFDIYRSGVFKNGVFIDYQITKLPKYEKYRGPKPHETDNAIRFMSKNDVVFAENGRLYALKERKYNDINDVIDDIINNKEGMGNYLKKARYSIFKGSVAEKRLKPHIVYF